MNIGSTGAPAPTALYDKRLVLVPECFRAAKLTVGLLVDGDSRGVIPVGLPYRHAGFGRNLRRSCAPVERLQTVYALLPPVCHNTSHDFDWRPRISVGTVVIVQGGKNFDRPGSNQVMKSFNVQFVRANTQYQNVDELLTDPLFHMQSVEVASQEIIRDPYGQKKRPAAFSFHVKCRRA